VSGRDIRAWCEACPLPVYASAEYDEITLAHTCNQTTSKLRWEWTKPATRTAAAKNGDPDGG
jgi:hypothetical protein